MIVTFCNLLLIMPFKVSRPMTMKKDGIQTRNRKIARKVKKSDDSKLDDIGPLPSMPVDFSGLSWPSTTQAHSQLPVTPSAPSQHQNLTDSQLQQMMYYNQLGYFQ